MIKDSNHYLDTIQKERKKLYKRIPADKSSKGLLIKAMMD